jgi:hypothetical protein
MIIIHIEPTEIHPHDDDWIEEQAQKSRSGLIRTLLGITLILISIFGFLIFA